MTGDGEGSGEPSRDEDDFEKQMRLANESDKAAVRASPSQAQPKNHPKRLDSDNQINLSRSIAILGTEEGSGRGKR